MVVRTAGSLGRRRRRDVTTLARLVDRALAPWRLASALLAGFAFAALVLTASGLFAVLHHFVSDGPARSPSGWPWERSRRRILRFVLGQGLRVTGLGLALGGAFSLVLVRSLAALLYGVSERDPWSYLGGAALVLLLAALACLLPARRAARVDPMLALRSE